MAYRSEDNVQTRQQRAVFAKLLRESLDRRGLTQVAAAEKGGITPKVLQRWLFAKGDPNPRVLRQFTAANRLPHLKLVRALGWL